MMGYQDDGQGQFLYHFDLEGMVPEDHLLRGTDRFLDLENWRLSWNRTSAIRDVFQSIPS
jgi:hypothetical protein